MISTLAIVAVVLAGVIVPGAQGPDDARAGRASPARRRPRCTTALRDAARADDARLELRRYPTVAAGEAAVRDGQADVLIVAGRSGSCGSPSPTPRSRRS